MLSDEAVAPLLYRLVGPIWVSQHPVWIGRENA